MNRASAEVTDVGGHAHGEAPLFPALGLASVPFAPRLDTNLHSPARKERSGIEHVVSIAVGPKHQARWLGPVIARNATKNGDRNNSVSEAQLGRPV